MLSRHKFRSFANFIILIIFFKLLFGVYSSAQAQTNSSVKDLVKSLSDGKLQFETRATPNKLIGDFNNDRIADVAVIVGLLDTVENIGKTVRIENPYRAVWGNKIKTQLLALLIIHGKGKGWQFAQKSSVLLIGRNSALIFEKERLNETGLGMRVQKNKSGKISIMFPTEASEGILKWNGKKYTWTETEP